MTGESFLYLTKVISSLFVRSLVHVFVVDSLSVLRELVSILSRLYSALFCYKIDCIYVCVTQWSKYALVCKVECMRGCVFIPCKKSN